MNGEDRTRLEEFRQFRKEVRGSAEYLFVGIEPEGNSFVY
jgi:hypothetical protein